MNTYAVYAGDVRWCADEEKRSKTKRNYEFIRRICRRREMVCRRREKIQGGKKL